MLLQLWLSRLEESLGIDVVTTRIMRAVAEALGVRCAVEVAAAVIIVASIVVVVVVHCLAFDAVVTVVVVVAGDLHQLWLCYQGHIAVSYSSYFGLFFCLVAIQFCFGGFRWFGQYGGD